MADEASQQANRSGMDPQRLVVVFYLLFGGVLALFFGHLLESLFGEMAWKNPEIGEGLGWHLTSLVGLGLAGGVVAAGFLHPRLKQVSLEVASELMRVTWPSWGETRVSTIAVVVASLIASVVLFGIDTFAYKLMVDWLPVVWKKVVNG
jgi:preprotein translocase subunit SecE